MVGEVENATGAMKRVQMWGCMEDFLEKSNAYT